MNIGSKALTWDKELEALTKELRAAGYSNREVVANGGMWQAPVDNKYRQEISDALSKVNTDVSGRGPLRAVLDHPELYKAYPWLQHVPVEIKQGARAFIRDAGPDAIQRFMISLPKGAERKTVLHETQHAIQNAEGWAKGGSPEMFKGTEMFSRDVAEALSKPGSYAIPEDILAALYRRLAGEAEARIIEARQYIKQEHLPQNFFGDFYDVDQAKLLDADRIK
jgi:hypothetical protein